MHEREQRRRRLLCSSPAAARANCCHVTNSSQLKRPARLQRVHLGQDLKAFEQGTQHRGSGVIGGSCTSKPASSSSREYWSHGKGRPGALPAACSAIKARQLQRKHALILVLPAAFAISCCERACDDRSAEFRMCDGSDKVFK